MSRTRMLVLVLGSAALAGCGPQVAWIATFGPDGGVATVDTTAVLLVFEGVPWTLKPGEAPGDRAQTTVKVSGWGRSTMRLDINGRVLTTDYDSGVNTIALEGYQVKLLDEGKKARVGDREFDLGGPKKTIVIHKDGTATVRYIPPVVSGTFSGPPASAGIFYFTATRL